MKNKIDGHSKKIKMGGVFIAIGQSQTKIFKGTRHERWIYYY